MSNSHTLVAGYRSDQETTPEKLKKSLRLAWILTLVFAVISMLGVSEQDYATRSIGRDTANSVFAAYRMKAAIMNLDANLAEELAAKPGDNYAAFKDFEKWRGKLNEQLRLALQHSTSVEEEKILGALNQALDDYKGAIVAARTLHERNDAAFLARYREALDILETRIVTNADKLEALDNTHLNTVYQRQNWISILVLIGAILSGGLLFYTLTNAQHLLREKFHRKYSLPLAGAITITLLIGGYTSFALLGSRHLLVAAKEDGYERMLPLLSASATAYEGKAAQNRWLLDDAQKPRHQALFMANKEALVKFSDGDNFETIIKEIKAEQPVNKGFSGLLAQGAASLNFSDEIEPTAESLKWYAVYITMDEEVRRLENNGKHEQATAFSMGSEENQSSWAFDKFDEALHRNIKITQFHFNDQIDQALWLVDWLLWTLPLFSVAIAVLVYLSVKPRLEEYGSVTN
jgi:hypothetical protein